MKIKTWSFFKLLIYASTCGFKTEFVYWLFYLVSVPRNAGNYFDTHLYIRKVKVLVTQSCPTLCDPMDCSLPGSSVHGFLQARILEWVAIPFSRESSQSRNQTQVSCTAGRFFTELRGKIQPKTELRINLENHRAQLPSTAFPHSFNQKTLTEHLLVLDMILGARNKNK